MKSLVSSSDGKGAAPAAKAQWMLFLAALQFFTRLPVPASVGHSQAQLDDAARYFPLVGLVVGAIMAGALALASLVWPPVVAALVTVGVGLCVTGAFHEDGLADAIDGLGGGYDRERRLAIMRDSRIGTFGAAALVLSLALRVAVLVALPLEAAVVLLIAGHVLSRSGVVLIMRSLPYVREDDGRAKPLSRNVSATSARVAGVTAVAVAGVAGALQPAVLGGAVLMLPVLVAWCRMLKRLLGGYTGDCLGAAQQLAELALYLGALALWSI